MLYLQQIIPCETPGAAFARTPQTRTSVLYLLFQPEQARPVLQLTAKIKSIGEHSENDQTHQGSGRL